MELEKLGPFKIGRMLGRGGMGAVYEGTNELDDSTVAIKVLTDSLEEDAEDRLRFEAEIETLNRLSHPNIVRLSGFGEEQGHLYYVMEFVAGSSLHIELRKRRLFQWHEAAIIGIEICQALRHAHDRGVIHRDIKPANILLDQQGNIKLSDFGIARFFGAQQITDVHSIVGTLEYMSPEQALGNPIGSSTDLYSLGCVLYVLLTGRPPFPARSLPELLRKHTDTSPALISLSRQDVPEELEFIIRDLLRIRPEDRPRNVSLVTKRLQSLLHALMGDPAELRVLPTIPETPQEPSILPDTVVSTPLKDGARINLLTDTVTLPAAVPASAVEPLTEPMNTLPEIPVTLSKSAARFVAVSSENVDLFEEEHPRPIFSLPTMLASLTLMIVGLIVYYLVKPVPPDVLYKRITAAIRQGNSTEEYDIASLRSVENDILNFLSRYEDHPLAEQVQIFQDELRLSDHERRLERRSAFRTLSPVERAYVEVTTSSPNDPEQTIDKLRAFIAVFQPVPSVSEGQVMPNRYMASPMEVCVELARRRLKKLEQEIDEINLEQEQVLRLRLEKAADWDSKDPVYADGIRRGIIELYQHHRWAAELVEEAKQELKE